VAPESNCAVHGTEFFDAAFDFRTEMAHETLNGPGSRISQSANRATFNLFS
jgi:hypothetical protein